MSRLFETPKISNLYSLFRPKPPPSLIEKILKFASCNDRSSPTGVAVDVGCGTGQSTTILSPYFKQVIGYDISSTQIAEARKANTHANIDYRIGSECSFDVPNASVQLVTTCQALHWFDVQKFYREVDRVLIPGGTLAVFGYHLVEPSPQQKGAQEILELRNKVYGQTLQKYSPTERKLVDSGYADILQISYPENERDGSHCCQVKGTLADYVGYIKSWSGFHTFVKEHGEEKAAELIEEFVNGCLSALNADSDAIPFELQTRYFLILSRKPGHQ